MVVGLPAALAYPFKAHSLSDVGHDPSITPLLTSSMERPRRLRLFPQWDLSLVFIALFEPLQLTSPELLVWKMFFLILFSSGVRRGKLCPFAARAFSMMTV